MRRALLLLACLSCTPSKREVRLFAAASLGEAFAAIEVEFEAAHPDIDLVVSTAGSQTLRLQIEHGARADLFVSANTEHARAVASASARPRDERFAGNALVLAVPADNPAGITRLADLPRARRVVLGDPTVPVGRYARAALRRAGLESTIRVVSTEPNARLVTAKLALGEADAALVYRTDVRDPATVRVIELPWPVAAEYRLVTLRESAEVARVQAFLRGPARRILRARGFVE